MDIALRWSDAQHGAQRSTTQQTHCEQWAKIRLFATASVPDIEHKAMTYLKKLNDGLPRQLSVAYRSFERPHADDARVAFLSQYTERTLHNLVV